MTVERAKNTVTVNIQMDSDLFNAVRLEMRRRWVAKEKGANINAIINQAVAKLINAKRREARRAARKAAEGKAI